MVMPGISGIPSCAAAAAGTHAAASMMLYRMNFTIVSPLSRARWRERPAKNRQREEMIRF
jgi:hypothetical protein